MPALNEERTLSQTLRAARGTSAQEIIVVDDGSTDSTATIVRRHAALDARVTLCCHEKNQGPGAARKTGILNSTSSVLVFFDCDVENITSAQLTALMRPFETGGPDFVMANFDNFGRVTEYLVRPLLASLLPGLAFIGQPLSGMFAARRGVLSLQHMENGHAISRILLHAYFEGAVIQEAHIGQILHRKRADEAKTEQAVTECSTIIRTLIERGVLVLPTTPPPSYQTLSRQRL